MKNRFTCHEIVLFTQIFHYIRRYYDKIDIRIQLAIRHRNPKGGARYDQSSRICRSF